jgi:hypothetical protein
MTVDAGTVQTDVHDNYGNGEPDDGFADFLSSFKDEDPKKKVTPSETDEGATEDQGTETPEPEVEDEGEPEAEDTEDDTDPEVVGAKLLDAEIEIKIGDEVKKVPIKELTRLYGQEAALTQKSQKTAEALRGAEEQTARAVASAKAILERAQARYQPYKEINDPANWAYLATQMGPAEFQQLRQDAKAAEDDVKFLEQEVDGYMRQQQQRAGQAYREAAQACLKDLSDPQKGIKDWSQPLYNELMTFAAEHGVPEMRQSTSPGAIRLLHMAMQFAKAAKDAKKAEDKVTKAISKPSRVIKPGSGQTKTAPKRAAMAALRDAADDPDAAAGAFLATF